MRVNQAKITRYYDTYAAAPQKAPFVITNSAGFVEIAVKNGNAASKLDVDIQDTDLTVTIEPCSDFKKG